MASADTLENTPAQAVGTWTFLSPVAESTNGGITGPFRLNRPIAGVRVGFLIETAWDSFKPVLDEWKRLLMADGAEVDELWLHGDLVGAIQYKDLDEPRGIVDAWATNLDCVVVGLANCGGCTASVISYSVHVEDRGFPTLAIVTAAFEEIAKYLREQQGHGELNLEILPYPLEHESEEYLRRLAQESYPRVLAKLGAVRG